jgi:hypothetical protein
VEVADKIQSEHSRFFQQSPCQAVEQDAQMQVPLLLMVVLEQVCMRQAPQVLLRPQQQVVLDLVAELEYPLAAEVHHLAAEVVQALLAETALQA